MRAVVVAIFRTVLASEQGVDAVLTIRGDQYRIAGAGFAIGWQAAPPAISGTDTRQLPLGA